MVWEKVSKKRSEKHLWLFGLDVALDIYYSFLDKNPYINNED